MPMRLRQRSSPQGLKIRSAADGDAKQERPSREAHDRHVARRQEHPLVPAYGDRCDVAKHRPGGQQDGRDDNRGDAERNGKRGGHTAVYVMPARSPDETCATTSEMQGRGSVQPTTRSGELEGNQRADSRHDGQRHEENTVGVSLDPSTTVCAGRTQSSICNRAGDEKTDGIQAQ